MISDKTELETKIKEIMSIEETNTIKDNQKWTDNQ